MMGATFLKRWYLFTTMILLSVISIQAQKGYTFGKINRNLIIETKWKYTYTEHKATHTILHNAEDGYEYFIYFKYNHTCISYLNKKTTKGKWYLKNRKLQYSFKNNSEFTIPKITNEELVLEFTQANGKQIYLYHFKRVDSKEAPFLKPKNELPLVKVDDTRLRRKNRKRAIRNHWWEFWKQKELSVDNQVYIKIELIGGGYYGGIDPVLRDYIVIKTNGRLIKEFQSVYNGLTVVKKNIDRKKLEEFAQYIIDSGFFNFEQSYDCKTYLCSKRKKIKPMPIPLRLAVTYGKRRKVITINIWGKDKNGEKYIKYPKELDNIIEAIQNFADPVI